MILLIISGCLDVVDVCGFWELHGCCVLRPSQLPREGLRFRGYGHSWRAAVNAKFAKVIKLDSLIVL